MFKSISAAACFSALAAAMAGSAQAGGFDERTIRGDWVLSVEGRTTAASVFPSLTGTTLFAIATFSFDGEGGCASRDQIVLDGDFIPSRDGFRETAEAGGACVYSVNPDGTGFFDVTFPGAPATLVTFVIVDRDRIQFIANNAGLGIYGGGELRRQRPAGATND